MGAREYRPLSDDQAAAQAPAPWQVVDGKLEATYPTGSMVRGLEFVTAIVAAAEQADHHPDIDFRYGSVTLRVNTHAVGGLTDADVALADAVGVIAVELGLG